MAVPRSIMVENQRLDKWLYYVRLVRTRHLAAEVILSGKVRLNHQKRIKPSFLISCGEVLTLSLKDHVFVIRVAGIATRRLAAKEAVKFIEKVSPQEENNH